MVRRRLSRARTFSRTPCTPEIMRRAPSAARRPHALSAVLFFPLLKRGTPKSSSSFCIERLRAGCEIWHFSAAPESVPHSAKWSSSSSCVSVTILFSFRYAYRV